jgi:mannose-1-phosphate guanylyltransferase/mannose-6-phosphate isomerase
VLLQDCSNTLALSEGRLVACVGVSDLVVVVQEDRTQDVKKVVDRLKQLGRTESAIHRKVFWH